MQHLLHQIKAQQSYSDLGLYQQCLVLQKIEEFNDFSRLLRDFPVLFKDFSRKPKFKYLSSLCEPCKLLPYLHLSSSDELNVVNGVIVEFNLAYGAIHSPLAACSMNQTEHFSAENQKIHRTY